MSRYDPLRDTLVDDSLTPAQLDPVITQCEGNILALDSSAAITGRKWDPVARRYRRVRIVPAGTATLRITRVGATVTCFGTVTHPNYSASDNASWLLTSNNPFGEFGPPDNGSHAIDGLERSLAQYIGGSIGDLVTLTYTFPDTSTAQDQKLVP